MSDLSRFNIRLTGQGDETIMFAHGYGCDQTMWRYIAPIFEKDYQVLLFDYVGARTANCKHYSYAKYGSLHGYAEDVNQIIDALRLSKVHFVGHSVSSMIGVLASIQCPHLFASLSLVAPSPCYINEGTYLGGLERHDIDGMLDYLSSNYLGWTQMITPRIMGNPDKAHLVSELENSFCQTDPEIAKNFARVTFLSDNRSDLAKVQHPTLIMQCSNDVIAPEAVGHYMHKIMPTSELALLEATGHCPNLSAPEETASVISDYLKRLSWMS